MKGLLLLSILGASPLLAQNVLYVDLSGEWRMKVADDPAFARPDFDDSRWEPITLPGAPNMGARSATRWLRRAFTIPPGAETGDLVLTIGGFSATYEVYFNGVRIGDVSAGLNAPVYYARARLFAVPAGLALAGNRNAVALREVSHQPENGTRAPDRNAGPYLLTSRLNAPVNAPLADREERLQLNTPGLVAAVLNGLFTVLLLLLWVGERDQMPLLRLALFLACASLMRFGEFASVYGDYSSGSPVASTRILLAVSLFILMLIVQDHFEIRSRAFRVLALAPIAMELTPPDWTLLGLQIREDALSIYLYAAVALQAFWLVRRWNQYRGRRAILTTLTAVTALFTTRVPSKYQLVQGGFEFAGYRFRMFDTAVAVLTLVLIALLLRKLAADRREKQRLAAEVEAARAIQQLLLPASENKSGPFEVSAVYEPAQEVGGDLHWMRYAADGSLLVVVGDVSGKGLKAAMLVSVSVGILRNEKSMSPAAVLRALNQGLAGRTGGGFVTCCCARFDPDGTVTLANAGNPAPYCDGDEVETAGSLPLGIGDDADYPEIAIRGRYFTFVSDGVIEAEDPKRNLFGFDRTRQLSGKPAREIAAAAKAWGQNDDITVVTVRRAA
jgi:phosphoserine phosphatase RsbU/P